MEGFNMRIPVENIHPHPGNPRKELGDISELVQSVKANGIFQPLSVIPILAEDGDIGDEFTVIMGHRRLAAAKAASKSFPQASKIRLHASSASQPFMPMAWALSVSSQRAMFFCTCEDWHTSHP